MTKKNLIYVEMIPAEGMLLTDSEIYTTYVCCLEKYENDWSEVKIEDVDHENLPYELKKEEKKEE